MKGKRKEWGSGIAKRIYKRVPYWERYKWDVNPPPIQTRAEFEKILQTQKIDKIYIHVESWCSWVSVYLISNNTPTYEYATRYFTTKERKKIVREIFQMFTRTKNG